MIKTILVSGGSGLIGNALVQKLLENNYSVHVLSRSPRKHKDIKYFTWDPSNNYIDPEALSGVDSIIHLAGASIGEEKWSDKRKKLIIDSRVKSADLLYDALTKSGQKIESFISSSAVGYYGAINDPHIFTENDPANDDFMGRTCLAWEDAADKFSHQNIRVVKIRTGLVLSKKGGLLAKLRPVVKAYLGSAFGSGKQYMPWIHIEDLVNIYLEALTNSNYKGAYNAVAPEHKTNTEFVNELAYSLNRKVILPSPPSFLLKMILGEMSVLLTKGSRVSSEKLVNEGFEFAYPDLKTALASL